MEEPKRPPNEEERLAAIRACGLLATDRDPTFDQITRLAAQISEAPIALLSVVDREHQWFKSRSGLDVTELSRAVSFCGHAILSAEPLIVRDALDDPRFRDNPLVVAAPHIRFYAGIPIRVAGGHAIGTLCILDRQPRELDGRQLRLLRALARQAEVQIDIQRRLAWLATEPDDTTSPAPDRHLEVPFRLRLRPDVAVEHLGGAFTELSGYPAERFTDDAGGRDLLHPEDAPLFAMLLSSPERFERPLLLRWRMADGRYRWLEHEVRPVEEHGILVAIEGVARPPRGRLVDDGVEEISPRLPRTAPPDPVALLSPAGTIESLSASAAELVGDDPDGRAGRPFLELVHPDDRERVSAALAAGVPTDCGEIGVRRADGSFARLELLVQRLGPGVLAQLRDPSDWSRAQEELGRREAIAHRLALSRQQLVDELRTLQRRRDQLTTLIVHDLKTPLTAIMMNAHLVLEEARTLARPTSPARDLLLSAEAMQRMIVNLLDVSRSETRGLDAAEVEIDLARLVRDAGRRLAAPLEARQQQLSIEDELADPTITGDPQLLGRMLQNLLGHGVRYAPPDSTLTVRLWSEADDRVRISMSDRGPAVPDAYKWQIFDPYARLDRDAQDAPRTSRGLALSFCQLAVGAHHGRLWIEDGADGGNRFCVDLPRRRAKAS